MEEEAYAQAKEEKEEDEGTFQVDYLLHLSNALSVFYVLIMSWTSRGMCSDFSRICLAAVSGLVCSQRILIFSRMLPDLLINTKITNSYLN